MAVDASRVICIDLRTDLRICLKHIHRVLAQNKKPAKAGFLLCATSLTRRYPNAFELTGGNAFFPFGRASDVGAGAT